MVQVAGLIAYHAAGLIAYQVAGLLSISPRGYSAGGSALSCRWVLLFSIMPAVYIIMPRGYIIIPRVLLPIIPRCLLPIMQRCLLPIMPRVHGSGSRSYCLSGSGVIVYHAAGLHHHAGGLVSLKLYFFATNLIIEIYRPI